MAAEARASVNQVGYIGPETVVGLAVGATKRLPSLMIEPAKQFRNQFYRRMGNIVPTSGVRHREWSAGTFEGGLDYEELVYVLSGLFGEPTPTNPTGSVYQRVYSPDNNDFGTPKSYTCRYGDSVASALVPGLHFNSLELSVTEQEAKINGALLGLPVDEQAGPILADDIDEVQLLTITGSPTGGTFTLTFESQETGDLPYNATAAEIETALLALSTIDPGEVKCFGGQLPDLAVSIHFRKGLGGANTTTIISTDSLTGGSSPQSVISTPTAGGGSTTEIPQAPVSISELDIYLDSSFGAIGTSKWCEAKEFSLSIPELRVADFRLCTTYQSWKQTVIKALEGATGKLTLVKTTNVIDLIDTANAKQKPTYYLRAKFVGPLITSTYYQTIQLDLAIQLREPVDRKNVDGEVYAHDFDFQLVGSSAMGGPLVATIINTRATL